MKPCPCGYQTDPAHNCTCSRSQIKRYMSNISGPLLDRIDIHVEVPAVPFEQLSGKREGESSENVRRRVEAGRLRQTERFADDKGVYCNAHMGRKLLKKHCELGDECRALLSRAVTHYGLSARAHDRILKVARTIADLVASSEIAPEHLAEAIQYRSLDRTAMK